MDAQQLIIIAMKANGFKEDKEKTEQVGMNDYIMKPLENKDVYETLIKWM